ncbi:hypothetical protein NEMBOFW57_000501 [Staphylotrichum longicolle]|uniref:PLD phosphodiesterase domain-containing protein n=1 Tax=Staphylotrichum longicolle TaxID=669026 RepID=A0AAD4F080_9PEZI|nr:hypothetical protein NEMBOFW57_000501 [Staphylotrichum longicolle]
MADNWAAEINGDEDDDEALRIAIAMSLGQDPGEKRERPRVGGVIDLTKEDDDGSTTESGDDDGDDGEVQVIDGSGVRETSSYANRTKPAPLEPAPASSLSALGLDRKKMEEERLARLSKRKAAQLEDAQPPSRPAQRPRTDEIPTKKEIAVAAEPKAAFLAPASEPTPASTSPRLPFPQGVVKKTWAYGQPRQGDDIKIEEVLQKQQLELAVLSSYQWDEEWLLRRIDLARTKLILIAFATDDAQKEEMRANVPRDRIRFCFPPMQPMGSMHSKLQLLKYEKYMRIVVPTGNLMSFDWGETGTMENMVFIIDLPKLQSAEQRDAQALTPFAEELFYFLQAQGLDEKLLASLRNYDFSATSRYQFVHTIPIELDFVSASLGAVNSSLLSALYYACQGDSGLKEYASRTLAPKGKGNASADEGVSTVKRHTRIFFPSRETVLQSKGGKDGAGTICFQAKSWHAATFPRELLRDCKSRRSGLVMHSKVIYVRPHNTDATDSGSRCFAYVGSANLSESAWGRLVKDRASGKPKLTCRNWMQCKMPAWRIDPIGLCS